MAVVAMNKVARRDINGTGPSAFVLCTRVPEQPTFRALRLRLNEEFPESEIPVSKPRPAAPVQEWSAVMEALLRLYEW